MKIKNESHRTFYFNGGAIVPGEVVDVQDVNVANALIKGYKGELFCLDTAEVKVIPAVAPQEEAVVEEVATRKKAKSKKAK